MGAEIVGASIDKQDAGNVASAAAVLAPLARAGEGAAGFTPDAIAYLERQCWTGGPAQLAAFLARAAAAYPGTPIDDAQAAVLLHGERRIVDHWLATADTPRAMPNRRRPPPIVAAAEVIDLTGLWQEIAAVCSGAIRSDIDTALAQLGWRQAPPRLPRSAAA